MVVSSGGSAQTVRPEPQAGVLRLARLRARVLSRLARRSAPEGRPVREEAEGIAAGAQAVSPLAAGSSTEVQASHGVAGTQSETSLAVSGSRVVVGFNQLVANSGRGSGVAYSTDGGVTYTDNGGLPVGGPLPRELVGDPSVTVCGDGVFYYASLYFPNATDSALSISVGTFAGTTLSWSNPKIALTSSVDFIDKEWLTCDRATNTLYLAYTRFVNGIAGPAGPLQIEITRSIDGGTTWTSPLVLEGSATESVQIAYVAVGPNGEVYVLWERGIDDIGAVDTRLEFRRSFDSAATFDPKVVVRVMTPSFFPANVGYNREDTLDIGTLAVDTSAGPNRGSLYVIWVERENPALPPRDVFLARSTDRGSVWSAPVRVNDDAPGHDQVMPWVSVNGSGTIETIWYDHRNWPGMYTVDLYAARSIDGGRTFGPNFRVTTTPSSWLAPATFTPNFGDYGQCASEESGFYPSWADSRNNDIDVFTAHVATQTCGNGSLDPYEQCDDGNTLDGDSCSGACASTPCGNGVVEGAEECDDGNIRSGDGCSQTCRREICGDGIVQAGGGEECDDGNLASLDGCSSTCQIELDRMAFIVDERSRLALMSVVNGRVQQIGDPGFHEIGDLAFDASGRLFGSTQHNDLLSIGFNGVLFDMPALGLPGRGRLLGTSGQAALTAIDFHPTTGALYAIAMDDSGASRVVTLDPASGSVLSLVADLGATPTRAMAFDASGTLYLATSSLSTLDVSTGAKTPIGPIYQGVQMAGIDFAPDGTLYGVALRGTGADGGLFRINKTTGSGIPLFGSGRVNQQGIRFAPQGAVDRDLDGVHDLVDCAPADPTNASPGLVQGLAFTDGRRFLWSAAPGARQHNVYRGTITAMLGTRLPGSVFDHVCFESADSQGNGDLVSSDNATPPSGTAFYYLAGGEGCGDGPLDSDAAHPVPIPAPCPTPP